MVALSLVSSGGSSGGCSAGDCRPRKARVCSWSWLQLQMPLTSADR